MKQENADALDELEKIARAIDNMSQTQAISGIPCEMKCFWYTGENDRKKSKKVTSTRLVRLLYAGLHDALRNLEYVWGMRLGDVQMTNKDTPEDADEILARVAEIRKLM